MQDAQNYTPLDLNRLTALQYKKAQSPHGVKRNHIPSLFLTLSVLLFVGSVGFAVTRSQAPTTQTQATAVPTTAKTADKAPQTTQLQIKDDKAFLKSEIAHLHQTVTNADIQARFKLIASTDATLTPETKDLITYTLMKERVIETEVESRTGYIVGMWLPEETLIKKLPAADQQKIRQQQSDKELLLGELANGLDSGKTVAELIPDLYDKYPSLQSVLSVNGVRITPDNMKLLTSKPEIYEEGNYDLTTPLYKLLFSMKKGDTKMYTEDLRYGSGGYIVQVLGSTHSSYKSYVDLINKRAF